MELTEDDMNQMVKPLGVVEKLLRLQKFLTQPASTAPAVSIGSCCLFISNNSLLL